MRRKILLITAIVLLIGGVGFLMFAPISNFIGTQVSHSQTKEFDRIALNVLDSKTPEQALQNGDVVQDKDNSKIYRDRQGNVVLFRADLDRLLKDSVEYNENLREHQYELLVSSDAYSSPAFDLSSYGIPDGIYAYVSVPKIDMKLPVYLGANGENMSYGAAHMTYTSLPIGGKKSNCVLAGHTDYVGRIFFDNLRSLTVGDKVSVTNFWQTLDYHVVMTEVCKPDRSQNVFINDERDLLTLFTCISNDKGGFDRYYVICERDN